MSFKDKPLKKCHTDKRKMIDDIHNELVKDMKKEELLTYYQENGLLLEKYYSDSIIEGESTTENKDGNGILMYFTNKNNNDLGKKQVINQYMCNIDDTCENMKYKEYTKNRLGADTLRKH